jgi:hypothetical protein
MEKTPHRTGDARIDTNFHRLFSRVTIDQYAISDTDDAGAIKYYGSLAPNGNWMIIKEDSTKQTFRYAKGASNYVNNWKNRATLNYDYFDITF